MIQPNDVVVRKSYGCDVLFKVKRIYESKDGQTMTILKGIDIRLVADAPLDDLQLVEELDYNRYRKTKLGENYTKLEMILGQRKYFRNKNYMSGNISSVREKEEFFDVPGSVLHIDGDEDYLEKCLSAYKTLKIPHNGYCVPEKEQPNVVLYYLQKHQPDILVITGHDGLLKGAKDFSSLDSYRNSRNFVAAVKSARKFIPGRDDLVIFAGACQSHYEALLQTGANFASSPRRVFIHAFDPVFIVEKIAFASINETLALNDILSNTVTGIGGVGGIETRGRFRLGFPKSPY